MEVKVFVDGIQRVVCGVTEDTTCQEVVLALAQALGQPGRYTLREKFKDFERCMTPDERLLVTLERYGEQARDVQLTLVHNGPSAWDPMSRAKVGRYQPCPPLRRKDGRTRRGSGLLGLHRQSLPLLSSSKQEAEADREEVKRPKRKSLTLMEEAWDWLESLGRGKVYSTRGEKDSSRRSQKKNGSCSDADFAAERRSSDGGSRSKARGQRGQQTTCCIGSQTGSADRKHSVETQQTKEEHPISVTSGDEKDHVRGTILSQLKYLQGLQQQIAHTQQQILELEGKQEARRAEQEARERLAEEEMEQIQFWEQELKAEEAFEKDLQSQFVSMRAKAGECKVTLDEYRHRLDRLGFFSSSRDAPRDSDAVSNDAKRDVEGPRSDPDEDGNVNRKSLPKEDVHPPHAPVPLHQIRERRPTGPTELREWWSRWSQAQSAPSQTKKKVIHRSELTIYLCSTKV